MMKLTVNGRELETDATPDTPLLWVLRDHLGLTGTKFGCGMALCGACTVHLEGAPIRSCVTPLAAAEGRRITTIEGLAQNGTMHPMQAAFRECHGLQCGFCTPGMVMSSVQLLADNPKATDAEIREGLDGNICRCTGYQNIVTAVRAAVDAEPADEQPPAA